MAFLKPQRRKCDVRMKFHEMNEREVEQALNTDIKAGLTEDDVNATSNMALMN